MLKNKNKDLWFIAMIKTDRDAAKDDLHTIDNILKDCKVKESEIKTKHADPSRCRVMNWIESSMLKKHKVQRSCYHVGDIEGNDVRILIGKAMIMLNEAHCYSRFNKPSEVRPE